MAIPKFTSGQGLSYFVSLVQIINSLLGKNREIIPELKVLKNLETLKGAEPQVSLISIMSGQYVYMEMCE